MTRPQLAAQLEALVAGLHPRERILTVLRLLPTFGSLPDDVLDRVGFTLLAYGTAMHDHGVSDLDDGRRAEAIRTVTIFDVLGE